MRDFDPAQPVSRVLETLMTNDFNEQRNKLFKWSSAYSRVKDHVTFSRQTSLKTRDLVKVRANLRSQDS